MDIRALVGRNVARLRIERAMTQEALSETSGITQSYLSQIENGHINLTLLHIHDLSHALGVHPHFLFNDDANLTD
jgi:transcriptional regulator with XRE-family HTH domain